MIPWQHYGRPNPGEWVVVRYVEQGETIFVVGRFVAEGDADYILTETEELDLRTEWKGAQAWAPLER